MLDRRLYIPSSSRMSLGSIHEDLTVFELISQALAEHGGEQGFNEVADIVTETADGVPLGTLWAEFRRTVALLNRDRQAWINRLAFRVAQSVEKVPVAAGQVDFEEASEFGVPKGIRGTVTYQSMGYPFKWYDIGVRYTWMFLAENTAEQVRSMNALALEASIRLQFTHVFRAIFNPTNGSATIDGNAYNVYKFYNADGTIPPAYKTTTFDGTHTHYLASGATTVDSTDLDDMIEHLEHHGYTMERGFQHILWVNKAQGDTIRTFRIADGDLWDFIPGGSAVNGGIYLDDTGNRTLINRPTLINMPGTIGTYGPFVVIQDDFIPAGFMFAQATGGEDNLGNPVGIREHDNASLRGLRLVKGADNDYPLVDSYYVQGLGTGVRHRGGGVVMKITAGSYAAPTAYA